MRISTYIDICQYIVRIYQRVAFVENNFLFLTKGDKKMEQTVNQAIMECKAGKNREGNLNWIIQKFQPVICKYAGKLYSLEYEDAVQELNEALIMAVVTLSVMQLTAYIINTSVFDFLENEGMIFQTGAIVSKIVVWLVYKGVYTYLDYMTIHFPKEQIVLTNVMIGFTTVSEGCIFLAVSQKGVSHYIVVLLMIVFLGIIALCGYVIYMMITISKKNEKMQLYQLIELKSQEQERQLEEWKHSEESMRKFRHDYKNHCMNMEHLLEKGEYESLDKYLKQFVSEELGEVRSIYSDSPIINAVFHNKMSICKEKGIDISCNITGSVKCLDDMGVGSILFNLLDNAIEACEKNKKEKRIVCQIAREADEVNIFLENSIDQSVLAENPSFETTKDKKDQHGMGHLIVEEQVKRLGGMVEYYEDEMFCAHIYLPM